MIRSCFLFSILIILIGSGCKKNDPEIPNEEEVITTLNYILTPVNGGNTVTFSFKDLDGDGGTAPVVIGGVLKVNTTYQGKLELLNEQENPVGNISKEVEEEGELHQFFFNNSGGLTVTVQYDDQDAMGRPIGLKNKLITSSFSAGKLTITLRHQPDKTASGVSSGNIANAGGETDIEVTFNVKVE